ncbi:cytochrome c assembly protein [groundwater metagenome]
MLKKILLILTAILLLASAYLVLFYAPIPIDSKQTVADDPNDFKIFYFHLPIAISAYLAFALVFISSILYLKNKIQKWDIMAASAAEVGVIFAFLTIVSGSIWIRSGAWLYKTWWVSSDVRLNTSLILFLIYLAYLMVRQAVDEPEKRARLSAVFGIVGFIGVPLSYLSIRLWNKSTFHPIMEFHPSFDMLLTVIVCFSAFFLLTASLIILRIDNEKLNEKINELKKAKSL